jgi:UDP-glucose/iron transport system ATP-binding protein
MFNGLRLENFSWHTLKGIDLRLESGCCFGLTGSSGAGKTLFLRALADLDEHGGQVWLDGVDASRIPAHQWRRQVGLLPAESAWWNDIVGAHLTEVPLPWLERLGFDLDVLSWQVRRLSSGERQRLALARLLINRPRVLLLDEPTANLDHENSLRVEALLKEYQAQQQPVIVWISHMMDQLLRWCDPIYIIDSRGFRPVEGHRTAEAVTTS